jgi:hypothetical protein
MMVIRVIKGYQRSILTCCYLIVMAINTFAAPIRPVGPVDVTGLISEITWIPEQKVKGQAWMSGSAGQDRIWPAHFLLTLINYNGVPAETAGMMTRYINWVALKNEDPKEKPSFILLKINHSKKNYLKKGMKIKVVGYTVRGDEGGTWTNFTTVEILDYFSPEK